MNVWIISPGKNTSIWEDCKNNGYIESGWNKMYLNIVKKLSYIVI